LSTTRLLDVFDERVKLRFTLGLSRSILLREALSRAAVDARAFTIERDALYGFVIDATSAHSQSRQIAGDWHGQRGCAWELLFAGDGGGHGKAPGGCVACFDAMQGAS